MYDYPVRSPQETKLQLQAREQQMQEEIAEQGRQLLALESRLSAAPVKQRALTLQVKVWIG